METKGAASRKRARSNSRGGADDGAASPVAASDRSHKKMKIDDDSSTSGSAQDTTPAVQSAPAVSKFTRKGKISINFEVNDEDASGKRPQQSAIAVASSTETVTVQPAKAIISKSSSSDEAKKKMKEKKVKKDKKEKKKDKKKDKKDKKEKKSKKDKKEKKKKVKEDAESTDNDDDKGDSNDEKEVTAAKTTKSKKKEKKEKKEKKSEASASEDGKRVHELRKHEKKLDLSRSGQQDGANAVTNTVEVAHVKGLHPTIVQNLEQQFGIAQFFPIQAQVIPVILRSTLLNRVVVRLRALVILPNRDLALQVKSVFDLLCEGTDLKVEIVVGQSSFRKDQEKLVQGEEGPDAADLRGASTSEAEAGDRSAPALKELVDILICTPGRLMDLLNQTRGFTLQHLRFLVIDEADRLLDQSFQDWLNKVLQATHSSTQGRVYGCVDETDQEAHLRIDARTMRQLTSVRSVHLSSTALHSIIPEEPEPLHKLLFSATLTNNPKKIAALRLNNPHFFSATSTGLYKMPEKLQEYMVICSLAYKPLVLLYLLEMFDFKRTLCFTSSVESTHRLYLLLTLMGQTGVAEYSSTLPQRKRTQIIEKFAKGDIKIVIASDAMSRGLDIEDVENVINYDVPPFIKTYVHRGPNCASRPAGQDVHAPIEVGGAPLQVHAQEGRALHQGTLRPRPNCCPPRGREAQ
ncbi:DEAD/DEAH box helicase domain containing protein [Acanthamoeba castellanii str. Neff]|uniref:DEAD/DEAH box helicase domain containing protein n=1 Tax=Acanthamoeba castellanii (strain ATCC 30010 / Neff) TaxID=1257118 RepID=L8HCF5_ACACF|nr:DEAD/DEAH box helicase domain containing protein [Acanthamoeba castellanii str. Neff]ELR22922.1 DEAD/DEAH box helicase domain containing protein [Acanthamoeba castellanii str. Neff]